MDGVILLTGATGLLGRYLLRDLLTAGQNVAVVVRPSERQSAEGRVASLMAAWERRGVTGLAMPHVLVGDITELTSAYDRAHALIGRRGGAVQFGELRHHCATSDEALYIIGVWESADQIRQRWSSQEMRDVLTSVGFPAEPTELTILDLHVIEPPL